MKTARSTIWCFVLLLAALVLFPVLQSAGADSAVETSARCAAVIESTTGRLLYGKSENARRPMASTTKICTAITVLENCEDIEKCVTVPDKAVGVEGSSIYLQRGEKVKIIDLLYGLMLQSGNDCAEALAITVGGSIEDFATLMNETARKAGAQNSSFVNPHGLHDDAHYTTAYDLAKITAYAYKNETFAKIVATKKHTMPWEGRDYPRVIVNKNKILSTYEGGDGVKTGFTKKAGRCLVSSATRNGMRVIAVVLDCGPMFEECSRLMDKAFDEFEMRDVISGLRIESSAVVSDGKKGSVGLIGKGEFYYPMRKGGSENISCKVLPAEELKAPVTKDADGGKFEIYLENQLLFTGKLYTIDSVAGLDYGDKLKDFIEAW